jgi:hypothetical protein
VNRSRSVPPAGTYSAHDTRLWLGWWKEELPVRRVLFFFLSCPFLCLVGIDSHKHTHSRLDTYIFLTLSLSLCLSFTLEFMCTSCLCFLDSSWFHSTLVVCVCVFVSVPPIGNKYLDYLHIDSSYYFLCVFMGRLYESRAWEDKAVRKLIAKGQVAALSKGYDYSTPDEGALHECPICFLYYPTMNTTSCCHANICTDCYLQVRPQPTPGGALKKKTSPTVPCPFCNQLPHHHKTFQIQVVTVTSQELLKQQVQEQEQEQQWAHLQRLKADQQQQLQQLQPRERTHSCSTSSGTSTPTTGLSSSFRDANNNNNNNNNGSQEETFGSCLDQDERVALFRKRSESVASSNNGGNGGGGGGSTDGNALLTLSSPLMTLQQEVQVIQSIAMTPEERMQLEQEMKNQQLHPLALKVEMEAEQRRAMNEQRHFQHQQQQQRTTHRSHQSRDWNSIINAYFDAQSNDTPPDSTTTTTTSSNDRHGRFTNNNNNNNNNRRRGESINDLMALEAALVFAMQRGRHRDQMVQPPQEESGRGGPSTGTSTSTATSSTDNDTQSMTNRRLIDLMNRSWAAHPLMAGGAPTRNHPLSTMDRPRAIPRTSSSPPRPNSSTRATTTTTRTQSLEAVDDTVSWLMQGLSEEEQLAIAIAASLQEQQQQQQQQEHHVAPSSSDDDDDDNDDIDSVEDLGTVDTLIASTVAQHAIEELSSVVNDDPEEVEEVAAIQGATIIESDLDSAALENDDDDDIPLNHETNRDDEE